MRTAIIAEDEIQSPSVGTWFPSVGVGAPIVPAMALGRLLRSGRWLTVVAPKQGHGIVRAVEPAGNWVACGTRVIRFGDGSLDHDSGAMQDATPTDAPDGTVVMRAETDGTVYLRPDPDAAAFVLEGAVVAANASLALVEVMKTFTKVRAPTAGRVVKILVDDAASVQAGDPLFWIQPGN